MTLFYILVTLLLANMKELNSKGAFSCIQARDNLHIKLGNDSRFPPSSHPLLLQGAFKQIYFLIGDINISYLNLSFANAIPKTGSFRNDMEVLAFERLNEPSIFWNAEQ